MPPEINHYFDTHEESLEELEDSLFDLDDSDAETVELETDDVAQALNCTRSIFDQAYQWQLYINALALCGCIKWFPARDIRLSIEPEIFTDEHIVRDSIINTVCNLKVNGFKVSLITTENLVEDFLIIPKAIVDTPEYIPHFYVIVEVQEFEEQVVIHGFLSYTQLAQYRQAEALIEENDLCYQLSLDWLEVELDDLLLYLCCASSVAISIPSIPNRLNVLKGTKEQLEAQLPSIASTGRPLWAALSWVQYELVLTSSELLGLYLEHLKPVPLSSNVGNRILVSAIESAKQKAINLAQWSMSQMENSANDLWEMLSPLKPVVLAESVRSPAGGDFDEYIQALIAQGELVLPEKAWRSCRKLEFSNRSLEVLLGFWSLDHELESLNKSEKNTAPLQVLDGWKLLLILRDLSVGILPKALVIQVKTETEILHDEPITNPEPFYVLRFRIDLDDCCLISLSLGGETLELEPLFYKPPYLALGTTQEGDGV